MTMIPPRNGSQSENGRGLTVRVQRSSTGGRHVRDADGAEEATNYDSTTPPPRHTPWRARGDIAANIAAGDGAIRCPHKDFIQRVAESKKSNVEQVCDLFAFRLIKTFDRFVCRGYINKAQAGADVGIIRWKPKQFPHFSDYYSQYTRDFFKDSGMSGTTWRINRYACPVLQCFIAPIKTANVKTATYISKQHIRV